MGGRGAQPASVGEASAQCDRQGPDRGRDLVPEWSLCWGAWRGTDGLTGMGLPRGKDSSRMTVSVGLECCVHGEWTH